MNLTELVALLQKAPLVAAELAAVGTSVSAAVGGIGTAIEHAGETFGLPGVERFGQRLEALGTDFPKLWRGSRFSAYLADRVAKLSNQSAP